MDNSIRIGDVVHYLPTGRNRKFKVTMVIPDGTSFILACQEIGNGGTSYQFDAKDCELVEKPTLKSSMSW